MATLESCLNCDVPVIYENPLCPNHGTALSLDTAGQPSLEELEIALMATLGVQLRELRGEMSKLDRNVVRARRFFMYVACEVLKYPRKIIATHLHVSIGSMSEGIRAIKTRVAVGDMITLRVIEKVNLLLRSTA